MGTSNDNVIGIDRDPINHIGVMLGDPLDEIKVIQSAPNAHGPIERSGHQKFIVQVQAKHGSLVTSFQDPDSIDEILILFVFTLLPNFDRSVVKSGNDVTGISGQTSDLASAREIISDGNHRKPFFRHMVLEKD